MSNLGRSAPLAPAFQPSAVYAIPDLDAVDAIYDGAPGFIYARDGHPNARELAAKLTQLHRGNWGVVTGSGMGAIVAAILPEVTSGDRILLSSRLYGRTNKLVLKEFSRFNVTAAAVDVTDLDAVKRALSAGPFRLLIVETISNPMCRACDLAALAAICQSFGTKLVVDNTFASPVLCRPLELGADFVMESLTKIIGGHSDLILGYLGGSDPSLFARVGDAVSTWGLAAGPFECWQTLRSLETLDLRVRESDRNARRIADWLVERPGVSNVIYPGLKDHPDYDLVRRVLPDGVGHMLAFELIGGRDAVNAFLRSAPGIPFCPSLGHATTTLSHPDTTSHRYESAEEKRAQGITPGLVRLSVGCEPFEAIIAEMGRGLAAL